MLRGEQNSMCEPSEDPDRILVEKVVNRFCRDFFPPLPIFYRYFLTGNLLCQSSSYRENYDFHSPSLAIYLRIPHYKYH